MNNIQNQISKRTVKFKVWDRWNKEWYQPVREDEGFISELMLSMDGKLELKLNSAFLSCDELFPNRYIPVQYLNVCDKNDTDIYEGFIVRGYKKQGFRENVTGVAIKSGMCFVFKGKSESGKDWWFEVTAPEKVKIDLVEVVGSIFETPDLLAGSEELLNKGFEDLCNQ